MYSVFLSLGRRPPTSPLFPYTTLFRSNLRGASGPLPPGVGIGTLSEARRWVRLADSALRRGEWAAFGRAFDALRDRKSTRLNSSHVEISYAVFCLKKKNSGAPAVVLYG